MNEMSKRLKDMTLEELKDEACPIIKREQMQEKINRDNFFKQLAGKRLKRDDLLQALRDYDVISK